GRGNQGREPRRRLPGRVRRAGPPGRVRPASRPGGRGRAGPGARRHPARVAVLPADRGVRAAGAPARDPGGPMTLATDRWPAFAERSAGGRPGSGVLVVWRLELAKLRGQFRVRAIAAGCLVVPFLAVVGLNLQSSTPGDTPFGQWVHASGFAIPMVILGFGAQWLLPVLAGLLAGAQPVVGLSGQLVPAGHAAGLVVASWASELPPVLGFTSVAVMLSVVSRNSVV